MAIPRYLLALILAMAVCACEKKPIASTPTPSASPEPGFVGQPETATPASSLAPALPVAAVEAPATVNMDAADTENQLVKTEVLSRIDLMPELSPEEKDKLYVQVERARSMGKIITIPFGSGRSSVGASEIAAVGEKIKLPQIQKFADDPTVVFVVLGFADKKGDAKQNLAISTQRADSVVKALKERLGVMNVTHAVGMGSSEMFDAKNLDKNRVVEVWAVLP
jgi:outer membrane protein OmpA-like peptidoglycan-associated protein